MVLSWAAWILLLGVAALQWGFSMGVTSPGDLQVLQEFSRGIQNPNLLTNWNDGDPCGSRWAHVKCTGASVSALEMSGMGLGGSVTPNLNKLKSLVSIQLQGNGFTGPLPSLAGLSSLTEAYFGGNSFDTIPGDFFTGLTSLTQIFLDDNHLNVSQGWSLPDEILGCSKLATFSATNTSLGGTIPEFLGTMSSLRSLSLAYNKLQGKIPTNFSGSNLVSLQLNNQLGSKPLTGPITPVASMQSLMTLWLQVNQFSGVIPDSIGSLSSLGDLRLNDNLFVGLLPESLAQLPALKNFTIKGNKLVGSMPKLGFDYDASSNGFCRSVPGQACDPRVSALLDFADSAKGFTSMCTGTWKGNDPCSGWNGIGCSKGSVISVQLPNCQLTGNISESLANLDGLTIVNLKDNSLTGVVPASLVQVPTLKTLNLYNNKLSGPVPASRTGLDLNVGGNPLGSPAPGSAAPGSGGAQAPGGASGGSGGGKSGKKVSPAAVVGSVVGGLVAIAAVLGCLYVVCRKKGPRFMRVQSSSAIVVHPRDSSFELRESKKHPAGKSDPARNSGPSELRVENGGNLVISVHVLRKATRGFSEDTILGRGGFGVVYKGELDDGTRIAVKRMEAAVVNNKGLSEFQAEIEVLTKVRHRHLVALLGYCIEGNEKLLVYEFMPQGTLSQHLFESHKPGGRPLTWKQRLLIALDVARGIEYLHGLAHKSFIHRDLKPSNILLDDSFHAKVSDFGLVKLAPEGKVSVETRLAGTFGYLAPEYAVTGRVTTKVDLYSFGVILMELITGRQALDASRSEETMHLPTWFRRIKVNRETLRAALDPLMEITDEEFESLITVAELAGYCTMREPYQRPDMSHAVNVLAPMVERWKPSMDFDAEDANGGNIDLGMSLSEALRRWQATAAEGSELESFPTRPPGFADSFSSTDVR